jgi:hypothetical protein
VPLLLGAALFLMAGCSGHTPSAPSAASTPAGAAGRPAGAAPVLLKSVDLHLPVEAYLLSPDEQSRLDHAQALLVQRCMRRFGLPYEVGSGGAPVGPRDLMDRRYGVTDEAEARADGYHLGDRDPRTRPSVPRADLTSRQKLVLYGTQGGPAAAGATSVPRVNGAAVPPDGCAGEAHQTLVPSDQPGSDDLARSTNGRTFTASRADPAVRKALARWSGCMKAKGYHYPDPLTAMDDKRFQGRTSNGLERAVATADVACKRQTNLIGVWFTVESAMQKKVIAQHTSQFAAMLAGKTKKLKAAAAVLAASQKEGAHL